MDESGELGQGWANGPHASLTCWWCGAPATTAEHKIKARSLRRAATNDDGNCDARNLYKKSPRYEGELRSLNKGSEVRWPRNLCAPCNNTRSQPFDRAHDRFEDFVVANVDVIGRWRHLDWSEVFGADWERDAGDLARYFGKQLGCMLESYRLPVPPDLIAFLDGAPECPSVQFGFVRNWRAVYAHKLMRKDRENDGLSTFLGLLDSTWYETDGRTTGLDYGYHFGYLWVLVSWREGATFPIWCQESVAPLPLINGGFRERLAWRRALSGFRRTVAFEAEESSL